MNKHLKLVREFYEAESCPQAAYGANAHLSEMDIVMQQALLMEEGSELFKAIKAGDMVEILAGTVNLAYCALGAIAIQGADVLEQPVSWRHDGFVISLMRLFSDQINHCTSGSPDDYSAVYSLCVHLSRSFINADFDQAFQRIHDSKMAQLDKSGLQVEGARTSKFFKTPDLSEYLYE